jgi:hypothetical protein
MRTLPLLFMSLIASVSLLANSGASAQSGSEILLQETGVLEVGDSALPSGILYDEHTFEGSANVPIHWSSNEFQANLILLDPTQTIAIMIDSTGELIRPPSSAIENLETRSTSTGVSAGFSLSQAGLYRVIIAAPDAAATGQYSLSVMTETAPSN